MEPIRTLFNAEPEPVSPVLPERLHTQYDGDLQFPPIPYGRPYVIANFVSTLDGVVSFNIPGQSGGASISGSNEGDRFIMGLLRAAVDAVVVGTGTVDAVSREHVWIAEFIYPAASGLFNRYRQALFKTVHPLIVIISGTGRLDLSRAVFHTAAVSVLIITTEKGREELAFAGAESLASTRVTVQPAPGGRIAPAAILKLLKEDFGVALVLVEGGPRLFGNFLACGLLDELFLTIAPQIAGRAQEHPRPALVSNAEFTPATAPWLKLLSARTAGDHLYLHYRKKNQNGVK
jgi:riboflavin biosynthesis pyrimidine reductase